MCGQSAIWQCLKILTSVPIFFLKFGQDKTTWHAGSDRLFPSACVVFKNAYMDVYKIWYGISKTKTAL